MSNPILQERKTGATLSNMLCMGALPLVLAAAVPVLPRLQGHANSREPRFGESLHLIKRMKAHIQTSQGPVQNTW